MVGRVDDLELIAPLRARLERFAPATQESQSEAKRARLGADERPRVSARAENGQRWLPDGHDARIR
jgi:hypothetical protein